MQQWIQWWHNICDWGTVLHRGLQSGLRIISFATRFWYVCICNSHNLRICCKQVSCPANASGAPSCVCNPGFTGTLSFDNGQYTGTCVAVVCPSNSNGVNIPLGCVCNSGFIGDMTAKSTTPFFTTACTALPCSENANGAPACRCNSGFRGILQFSRKNGSYNGSCSAVACPDNSNGPDVSTRCTCDSGYNGLVTASSVDPFYVSNCTIVTCPASSNGSPFCVCNSGFSGSLNFGNGVYSGGCFSVGCPGSHTILYCFS